MRARPRRSRIALLALAAAALALLALPSLASAAKAPIYDFGFRGGGAGEFNDARGIAVNETGAGGVPAGTIYVIEFDGSRVHSFTADGDFVRLWGWNVLADAGTGFEVCETAADCQAATGGDAGGQFRRASGIAVSQATGDVYVADRENFRVQQFTATGDFMRTWGRDVDGSDPDTGFETCAVSADCKTGESGSGAGEFAFGDTVAIGGIGTDSTGNVYVADAGNARVQKFSPSGAFLAMGGWDVTVNGSPSDPGSVSEYQVCSVAADCKAGAFGTGAGQFGGFLPSYLATSSSGDVYVVGKGDGTIFHLDSTLDFDPAFDPVGVAGSNSNRNALAVNTADGHLFYARNTGTAADANVYELNPATQTLIDTHPAGADEWVGLAVNSNTGRLYGARTTSATFVRVLDEGTFPTLTATAPSGVSGFEATLNGTVNPNGAMLTEPCYFEYGPSGGYGQTVPCVETEATIGAGNAPVPVHADLSGLDPRRTYNFRLVAANPGQAKSANRSFNTTSLLSTQPATAIAGTTATLHGTVNPDGIALTDCQFEYVTQEAFDANGFVDLSSGGTAACDPPAGSIPTDSSDHAVSAYIAGLDPNGATYRFRLVATYTGGSVGRGNDRALSTADLVFAQPADPITGTTATLHGTVNPEGFALTDCRFEHITQEAFDASVFNDLSSGGSVPCDPPFGSIPADSEDHAVSAEIAGLQPFDTVYRFRLVVDYANGAVGRSTSLAFETGGPLLRDTYAPDVDYTEATLGATINPNAKATTYRFEYGTEGPCSDSANACTQVPDPAAQIGDDDADHEVSNRITGLAMGTTYHFRVIATNADAVAEGPDLSFTTYVPHQPTQSCPNQEIREDQGSTAMPLCLAWEMVSPPDKNQGGLDQYFWAEFDFPFSRSGDAAAFCTNAQFGDPAGIPAGSAGLCVPYLSRRTASGWQTLYPVPRHCRRDGEGFNGVTLGVGIDSFYLNPSFDSALTGIPESEACPIDPLDPEAPDQNINPYRLDLTAEPPFAPRLLAPNPTGLNFDAFGADDHSRVIYLSRANQTEEPDSPPPANFEKLYEWREPGVEGCAEAKGCLRLASVGPDGDPLTTISDLPQLGFFPTQTSAYTADGTRLYFQNGVNNSNSQRLFMREFATGTTFDLAEPECAVPADCGEDNTGEDFLWASPAGDVALFSSCAKLTDASAESEVCGGNPGSGDGGKLYRFDRNAPAGERLTDLSVDHEPADGTQPNVVGMIDASADAEVVYFITGGSTGGDAASNGGQILAGEETGPGMRLYRSEWNGGDPQTEYLGPYVSAGVRDGVEELDLSDVDPNIDGTHVRLTPDGEHLLIRTLLALDPEADADTDSDMYRYSAGSGEWACVSCQPPAVPSAGSVNAADTELTRSELTSYEFEHSISNDGRRVFFSARDSLAPEDANGEESCEQDHETNHSGSLYDCQDIYLWQAPGDGQCSAASANYYERNGGCLSLVTPGNRSNPFLLVGATASGDRVFAATREQMTGHDIDGAFDLYTARVGGGFPEPEAAPEPCTGEGCLEEGTDSELDTDAATGAIESGGNPSPERAGCARLGRAAQRHARAARRLGARARRQARGAKRSANPRRTRQMRRSARRYATAARKRRGAAKRTRAQARRCRAARAANANRRAGR